MQKKEIIIAACLVALAVLGRFLPHLPDATPLTAVTLASALYLGRRWAIVIPLVSIFLSDLLLGWYDWQVMASVYVSWLLIGLMSVVVKKYPGFLSAGSVVLGASLLFFVVTNFAVWAFSPWYVKDLAGLVYCFELGLPFFRNMLVGDLIYTPLLLGAFAAVRMPARASQLAVYAD